jgi:hypothetical protein
MYGLWTTSFLLIAMALSIGAAGAQTLQTRECTAANIAATAETIGKMKDSKQKATASEEIGAASEALAQGKSEECKAHLLKATLQTK